VHPSVLLLLYFRSALRKEGYTGRSILLHRCRQVNICDDEAGVSQRWPQRRRMNRPTSRSPPTMEVPCATNPTISDLLTFAAARWRHRAGVLADSPLMRSPSPRLRRAPNSSRAVGRWKITTPVSSADSPPRRRRFASMHECWRNLRCRSSSASLLLPHVAGLLAQLLGVATMGDDQR
jgi:hypothetical protein